MQSLDFDFDLKSMLLCHCCLKAGDYGCDCTNDSSDSARYFPRHGLLRVLLMRQIVQTRLSSRSRMCNA